MATQPWSKAWSGAGELYSTTLVLSLCLANSLVWASTPPPPHRTRSLNLTLYRVTPQNISGDVADLNTGDARGDIFFALYEMMFPLYCEEMPRDSSCSATSRAALNRDWNNVYERSLVEVDPRYGAYAGCTPPPSQPWSRHFVCEPYVNRSACWWEQTNPDGANFSTLGDALCPAARDAASAKDCNCSGIVTTKAVGAYNKPMAQTPNAEHHWHNNTPMWQQIEAIGQSLDGWWYATRAAGECKGKGQAGASGSASARGGVVGDGSCFFFFHGVTARVNATCVKDRLQHAVLARNPACFAALPQPSNRSATAWVGCLLATLSGTPFRGAMPPKSGATPPAVLLAAFEGAFATESNGGCPAVAPPSLERSGVTGV